MHCFIGPDPRDALFPYLAAQHLSYLNVEKMRSVQCFIPPVDSMVNLLPD